MKIFLCFFLLISFQYHSQINFDWAIGNQGNQNQGNKTKIDSEGNVLTVGLFSGTCDFDPSSVVVNSYTAPVGEASLFIQKINNLGQLVYIKTIDLGLTQGSSTDYYSDLFDLELGNGDEVFISGIFRGTVDFDPSTTQYQLINQCSGTPFFCSNEHDGFILKLNNQGDFQWAKHIIGLSMPTIYCLTLDSSNNVYFLSKGVTTILNTPIQNSTSGADRLISFDSFGNFISSKLYNNFIVPKDIHVYGNNLLISGDFTGTTTSATNIDGFNLTGVGTSGDDLSFIRTDLTGNVQSIFNIGGMYRDFQINSHTILGDGSVVICGKVSGYNGATSNNIDWDPTPSTYNYAPAGFSSFNFIVKYSLNGLLTWVKFYNLGIGESIEGVTSDLNSNIYLTGSFNGTIDFNLGAGTNILVSNPINISEIFATKLDSSANFVWAYSFGGSSNDRSFDIDVRNCEIAITGENGGIANFSTTQTTNVQGPAAFTAKYSCCQIPVDINLSGDTLTCVNDQLTLSVNQPNTTFSWYNGNTLVGNSSTLLVSSPGTFTLNATNSSGCFGQDQVTIVADTTEPILDYNLTDSVLTCQNPLITGTLNSPSGNSVSWTLDNTVISTTTSSQINIPGNLVISTTGLNGCTNTDSILITSTVTYPSIDFSVLDTLCAGQNLVLSASGNGQINWNPDLPNGSIVYPTVSQFYTANIIDSLGCENADSVYVNVIQGPNLAVTSDTICNGESANLSVTSATGTSIFWQTGQTTTNISLTANQDTSIYVFGILNGCYSDTLFANITVLPGSTVEIEVDGDSVLCLGGVVNLVSSQSIGNSWSTGQNSQTISVSQPQWVILSNTNPNGCISQDSINITTSGFPCLEIIDVFSPNDDGINDFWEIPGIEAYPKAEVSIFNRWGQLLFFSVGYSTPWNGKFNNEPLPTGDYFYIIDLGNGTKFNGSMTLKK